MYPVSDEYIKACRATYKEERITGWIRLKDGTVVEINDSIIIQGSLKTTREVFGSSFDIGTANCSKMTLKIKDDRAYDREFGGALIKLKYGLVIAVAQDGTRTWEEIPLTPYYVDGSRTTRKRSIMSLTAYDTISRLQVDVPDEIPTDSLYMALQYACNRAGMGVAISEEEFNKLPNHDIKPDFSSESIQSCRDVVMWIAQAVNCCAYTDYRGLLMLKQYKFTVEGIDRVINANERSSIEYSDTRTYLTHLQAYCGGDVKLYSNYINWTGGNTEHIKEGVFNLPNNPIIKSLTAEQQDTFNKNYLDSDTRGGPTRTIKITGAIDPAIEPLDVLSFSGGDIDLGNIRSVATRIRWVYHGKGTLYCGNVSEATDVVAETAAASEENAENPVVALSTEAQSGEQPVQRVQPKSQLEKRVDELQGMVRPKYVSLPVTNPAAINYDAIERGLLSVDFTVSGTDSAVVFAGAQQCSAASAGTVDIAYKVDGATQDFKPSQVVAAGKNILPHYLAMALNKGKHNFAVYITSADGRGSTPINGLAAALSGQISGIKISALPNDNLLLYFSGVPAGTTITLPQLYSGSGADKTVDWGDGSAAETSACNATVEHTYADGGDFVVTIKSTETRFMGISAVAWKEYLTAVYFPDNATYISWSFLGNCPNLGTVYLGKSATSISLTLTNCTKLTSLIFPDTAVSIGVTLTGTSVTDITIPAVATTARTFSSLTALQSIAFEGALLCSCQSDTSLKTVRMTDKINAIPDTCFSNCTSLADIDLPKTITKIGANAFSRCAKLPSLPLLPELTSVGVRAFEGCSGLSDAAFGDKLVSMGIYAFHNCASLSSVDIPSSLVTLPEGAFQACTGLTSVSHGGLMTIGVKAFEGCTQLAGFEFPPGLIVGSQAFAKTGFENVDVLSFMPLLTSGATAYGGKYNIGAQAFANCTKLSEVSGYKYKFSVGLRVTESTKEDGVWTTTETDMGEMADALGIYNAMGATSDSVFSGTALKSASNYLKEHPEYSNESTDTYRRTYTAYDIKSTD